ncbi:hypothetical protein OROGR_007028 [Orobanche gracilis]
MDSTIETTYETQKNQHYLHHHVRRSLVQFILPLSILSIMVSYFSGFIIINPCTSLFLFNTKCMFLIFNGILVFLARNSKLNNCEITELPQILRDFQEDTASAMENISHAELRNMAVPEEEEEEELTLQQEQEYAGSGRGVREIRATCLAMEINEEWEEEEEDAQVSTEELNKKFEEFIRRMKEELRIGARNTMISYQCRN